MRTVDRQLKPFQGLDWGFVCGVHGIIANQWTWCYDTEILNCIECTHPKVKGSQDLKETDLTSDIEPLCRAMVTCQLLLS